MCSGGNKEKLVKDINKGLWQAGLDVIGWKGVVFVVKRTGSKEKVVRGG